MMVIHMTSLVEKNAVRTARSSRMIRRGDDATRTSQGSTALEWTEMGQGVWVAKRDGAFAGLIEELWGAGYRVTDRTGAIIGEFATLQSARGRIE